MKYKLDMFSFLGALYDAPIVLNMEQYMAFKHYICHVRPQLLTYLEKEDTCELVFITVEGNELLNVKQKISGTLKVYLNKLYCHA